MEIRFKGNRVKLACVDVLVLVSYQTHDIYHLHNKMEVYLALKRKEACSSV